MQKSDIFWQYFRDKPAGNTTDAKPFKSKSRFIGKTDITGFVNFRNNIHSHKRVIVGELSKCF